MFPWCISALCGSTHTNNMPSIFVGQRMLEQNLYCSCCWICAVVKQNKELGMKTVIEFCHECLSMTQYKISWNSKRIGTTSAFRSTSGSTIPMRCSWDMHCGFMFLKLIYHHRLQRAQDLQGLNIYQIKFMDLLNFLLTYSLLAWSIQLISCDVTVNNKLKFRTGLCTLGALSKTIKSGAPCIKLPIYRACPYTFICLLCKKHVTAWPYES